MKNTITFIDKDFKYGCAFEIFSKELIKITPKIWEEYKKMALHKLFYGLPKNKTYKQHLKDVKKFWKTATKETNIDLVPKYESAITEEDIRVIIWDKQILLPYKKLKYKLIFG